MKPVPACHLGSRRRRIIGLGEDRPLLLGRPGPSRSRDNDVRHVRHRSRHRADTAPSRAITCSQTQALSAQGSRHRALTGRVPTPRDLLLAQGGTDRDRHVAEYLQPRSTAFVLGLSARPRLSPSRTWPSGYPWPPPCRSLSIGSVQNTGQVTPTGSTTTITPSTAFGHGWRSAGRPLRATRRPLQASAAFSVRAAQAYERVRL